MNTMVVFDSRCRLMSSSLIAACTETSSADIGSSAMITRGRPAKARATPMRCFWPPDNCLGLRCANARGSFTRSSRRSIISRRSAVFAPMRKRSSVRRICEPTE